MASYIGQEITIVCRDSRRYTGVLLGLDRQQNSVSLQDVHCYGTENRAAPQYHPPSSTTTPFVMFSGNDILDLKTADQMCAPPPVTSVPAQMMSQQQGPMYAMPAPPGMHPGYGQPAPMQHNMMAVPSMNVGMAPRVFQTPQQQQDLQMGFQQMRVNDPVQDRSNPEINDRSRLPAQTQRPRAVSGATSSNNNPTAKSSSTSNRKQSGSDLQTGENPLLQQAQKSEEAPNASNTSPNLKTQPQQGTTDSVQSGRRSSFKGDQSGSGARYPNENVKNSKLDPKRSGGGNEWVGGTPTLAPATIGGNNQSSGLLHTISSKLRSTAQQQKTKKSYPEGSHSDRFGSSSNIAHRFGARSENRSNNYQRPDSSQRPFFDGEHDDTFENSPSEEPKQRGRTGSRLHKQWNISALEYERERAMFQAKFESYMHDNYSRFGPPKQDFGRTDGGGRSGNYDPERRRNPANNYPDFRRDEPSWDERWRDQPAVPSTRSKNPRWNDNEPSPQSTVNNSNPPEQQYFAKNNQRQGQRISRSPSPQPYRQNPQNTQNPSNQSSNSGPTSNNRWRTNQNTTQQQQQQQQQHVKNSHNNRVQNNNNNNSEAVNSSHRWGELDSDAHSQNPPQNSRQPHRLQQLRANNHQATHRNNNNNSVFRDAKNQPFSHHNNQHRQSGPASDRNHHRSKPQTHSQIRSQHESNSRSVRSNQHSVHLHQVTHSQGQRHPRQQQQQRGRTSDANHRRGAPPRSSEAGLHSSRHVSPTRRRQVRSNNSRSTNDRQQRKKDFRETPEDDFDFESSSRRYDNPTLENEQQQTVQGDDNDNASGAENGIEEAPLNSEEHPADSAESVHSADANSDAPDVETEPVESDVLGTAVYDKAKSFFDDISVDTQLRTRPDYRAMRVLDTETFGDIAKSYSSSHLRGRGRGRGRRSGGRRPGRGGSRNNSRRQPRERFRRRSFGDAHQSESRGQQWYHRSPPRRDRRMRENPRNAHNDGDYNSRDNRSRNTNSNNRSHHRDSLRSTKTDPKNSSTNNNSSNNHGRGSSNRSSNTTKPKVTQWKQTTPKKEALQSGKSDDDGGGGGVAVVQPIMASPPNGGDKDTTQTPNAPKSPVAGAFSEVVVPSHHEVSPLKVEPSSTVEHNFRKEESNLVPTSSENVSPSVEEQKICNSPNKPKNPVNSTDDVASSETRASFEIVVPDRVEQPQPAVKVASPSKEPTNEPLLESGSGNPLDSSPPSPALS